MTCLVELVEYCIVNDVVDEDGDHEEGESLYGIGAHPMGSDLMTDSAADCYLAGDAQSNRACPTELFSWNLVSRRFITAVRLC